MACASRVTRVGVCTRTRRKKTSVATGSDVTASRRGASCRPVMAEATPNEHDQRHALDVAQGHDPVFSHIKKEQ